MDWERLVAERNAWVAMNFELDPPEGLPFTSIIGCFEELGELAHAHLKQEQGIRGTDAEHEANAKDAIGDLTVYLLGVMNKVGTPKRNPLLSLPSSPYDIPWPLLSLGSAVGTLGRRQSVYDCERIVALSDIYCTNRGWDYEEIVMSTWAKVKQRDWKANPHDGGEKDIG